MHIKVLMNRFFPLSRILNLYLLLVTILLSSSSLGQDIEEVVVEAERQEANTLDVTESLDIFDLEDLEVYRITGLADVANNVPGLTASPSGSQGLRFTLRGIGARDSQLGVESKIGLYVDGAYLGRASGLVFDIVDLEQVEVAKGPQGFRFGRHAIGGNINLITAKANVEEFYARSEVTVGNYGRETFKTTLNLPVNDQFAVRASAFTNKRDGWVENTGKGVDWGGFDREGFKIAARWYATDSLIIDYSYDKADFITQPVYYQPVPSPGYDQLCYNNPDISGKYNTAIYGNLTAFNDGEDCFDSQVILTPMTNQRIDQDEATLADIENSTTEADGHSLTLDWDWSENHNLKFIGTYRTSEVNNTFNFFPNLTPDLNFLSKAIRKQGEGGDVNQPANKISGAIGYATSNTNWYSFYGFENISLIGLAERDGTVEGLAYAQELFDYAYSRSAMQNNGTPNQANCDAHPSLCANHTFINLPVNPSFFFDPITGPGLTDSLNGRIAGLAETLHADDRQSFNYTQSGAAPAGQNGNGYAYSFVNRLNSLFASPVGGVAALDNHKQKSFELKQSGSFLDERLEYITGLYYFEEKTGNGPGNQPDGYLYGDIIELLDFGDAGQNAVNEDQFGFSYISINRLNTKSYAWYGSVDFTPLSFDERLTLSYGFRKSIDKRTLFRQKLQAFTLESRGSADYEEGEWDSFDHMLKVAYDITPDFSGYMSVTSGYRPGNFNVDARELPAKASTGLDDQLVIDDSTGAGIKFETESLMAFEFGAKGTLLDGLVDIEFATYYYNVKDGQETVIFPTSPISRAVVNADGQAYGAEVDSTWYLTDRLSFMVNYAQLRSSTDYYLTPFVTGPNTALDLYDPNDLNTAERLLTECRGGLREVSLDGGNCSEKKSNFGAPINSWQVGLDYKLPTSFGEIFYHLGYNYKDEHFVNDTLQVDARNIWDARISATIEQDWGSLKVAAWGQNIFDHEYQTQLFELDFTVTNIASYGDPAMFGIDVIAEWY